MSPQDKVRASRDGDQFHYQWAARECLALLPGGGDLVSVTIEGPSVEESAQDSIEAGEQLIDVGLYYGGETPDAALRVRYIQLKHSTHQANMPWMASGLKKTIEGFAERYAQLIERYPADEIAQRFRFEFTTNRPIETKVQEALADLASGDDVRHPGLRQTLVRSTGLDEARATGFFRLFSTVSGEGDLWVQRNLLRQDLNAYLPDADYDAPVQLTELVTRKATTEFQRNPAIRRHDVLHALNATEEQLQPAECLIPDATNKLPREQESEILFAILQADNPVIIHADGGVGKSVLAARLAASMPEGSEAVLYDCFGNGLYRTALHYRHQHRDAFVQMANELAARGLCHPLIPSDRADTKRYMLAFAGRLGQAVSLLRAKNPEASLCLIIDAADNAEMAAEEQAQPSSFVPDLIRTQLPQGVRLVLTCRTHRRHRLKAPPYAQEIELRPFSERETALHLRSVFPTATDAEVAEFAYLSSSNPRVQALALLQGLSLHDLLMQLGPTPKTVDRAIGQLLDAAVKNIRYEAGPVDASQIDAICQGIAVLRPLVPIAVLADLSRTSEAAVRSFALDLGRSLLLKGDSLHFIDEPAETWFRERFQPDAAGLADLVKRLRPLAAHSAYVAAILPPLLLRTGQLDELVRLALSGEGLPADNPVERRDVEVQRLLFALKACLSEGKHMAAAKLALKAGGECAGESRQNKLMQDNTDLVAVLTGPDRIEELVSRRVFDSGWMGSHHAYDAGLLSGRQELAAEASSRLRMAMDWLQTWACHSHDERHDEQVSDEDRAELALTILRLRGAHASARFLRAWTSRRLAFDAGRRVGQRLIDLGRYDQVDALAEAAGNDIWLLLGLVAEARDGGHVLPAGPLARLLRLLGDRRVSLPESGGWTEEWSVLYAVRSALELALRRLPPEPEAWSSILQRYLPETPPSYLADLYGRDYESLLRAYALEAALRGETLTLTDVAPPKTREALQKRNQYQSTEETREFIQEVGGLLPWVTLSTEIVCGRSPVNLAGAIAAAVKESSAPQEWSYRRGSRLSNAIALVWLRILRDAETAEETDLDAFRSWLDRPKEPIWDSTSVALCRIAARSPNLKSLALELAVKAYESLETSREDAESRADAYLNLARAVLAISQTEAGAYFHRAVEIASRVGDENLDRWAALLWLAAAAGDPDKRRPWTAYRLSRAAELTYEYVARDKYFDWTGTVEALAGLCASSALAILSRWRDRRFGDQGRLLPILVYRLVDQSRLPATAPIALGGLEASWERLADLERIVAKESDGVRRQVAAQIAYRYLRVLPLDARTCSAMDELGNAYGLDFPDIERLVAVNRSLGRADKEGMDAEGIEVERSPGPERKRRAPDWSAIFQGVDLTDSDALRAAYEALRTYDPLPYEFADFFREALTRASVGRQSELMQAVAAWQDFGIFELRYLLDALSRPWPKPVSLRKTLREAVLSACRREPERVERRRWYALIPFDELAAEGIVSDKDVVQATLEGFTAQAEMLGASALFRLIDPLASNLSPDEADEALSFGLDLLEDVLRPEDGDGPWRSELEPPGSVTAALAGYVWSGLGSPVVAERWQHAHVVRSAIELGWTELVDALIAQAESSAAGPFADQGFEFYEWHARQWLLIGTARGGMDNPPALQRCASLLQSCLRERHVLIRELAAQALRALVASGAISPEKAGDFDSVNNPCLPEIIYTGWLAASENETPSAEGEIGDVEQYYFGFDIGPYWLERLGRAFGLTQIAVERRARNALRQRMGWQRNGRREDARRVRNIFEDRETWHSHGTLPSTDDLSAYHGYHAMMLVAADLLEERPVRHHADEPVNEFQDWLSSYLLTRADGKWLADRRDPRLVADPPKPMGYGDELWRWSITGEYLEAKLRTDDGLVVLWGYWTGGEREARETVSVRSALVCRTGAEALVAALQTADDLDRFGLPSVEAIDDLEIGPLRVVGWVTDHSIESRLDEHDPWSEGLRYPGPAPSNGMIQAMGLVASADGRIWTAGTEGVLRSETWTAIHGYGRERETVSGSRLGADQGFLRRLLDAYPDERLIVSVSVHRFSTRDSWKDDELGNRRALYIRYYLMGGDGVAHSL